MPGIRSQSVNAINTDHATVTLDTHQFGLLFLDALRTGPGQTTVITMFKDGVQQSQVTLTNPNAAELEAKIDATITGMLPGGFKFASHLVSVSPLVVNIICSDVAILANWWQV